MSLTNAPYKSLFLPLKPDDHAVFASVCSLLTLSLPGEKGKGRAAAATPQPTARSTATFSPAEGSGVMEEGSEDGYGLGCGESLPSHKSALFAVLSGRADGAVAVLRNRDVVFFSLAHPTRGPVELTRFSPLPTTKEANAPRAPSSSSSSAEAAKHEATCAALLPLELTYLCRVDNKQQTHQRQAAPVYMRGLVGCKDGRVSVFSEASYIFGFAAHDCPVISVQAIYAYDKDGGAASPPGSPTGASPTVSSQVRSLGRATQHLGFVTAGKDGTVYVWRQHANGMVKPKPLTGATSVRRTVALCVYQPPSSGWFLSALIADPSMEHHRYSKDETTNAAALDALKSEISGVSPNPTPALATFSSVSSRANAPMPALEQCMPCPVALYALPGVRRCIRSQLLTPRAMAKEGSQKVTETLCTAEAHDYVLPNLGLFATTAIATDGDVCVLSYSNKLQAFPVGYLKPLDETGDNQLDSLAARVKAPVFTARKAITHVVLSGGLCVVACGRHGLVHVLRVPSFVPVCEFYTYQCRPIASVSVFAAAHMIAVVDALCGAVELVQVQQSALRCARAAVTATAGGAAVARESYAAVAPGAKALPSSVALRFECELEQVLAGIAIKGERERAGDIASRQDEVRAYQEALLLSGMAISPACETYLHANAHVL